MNWITAQRSVLKVGIRSKHKLFHEPRVQALRVHHVAHVVVATPGERKKASIKILLLEEYSI